MTTCLSLILAFEHGNGPQGGQPQLLLHLVRVLEGIVQVLDQIGAAGGQQQADGGGSEQLEESPRSTATPGCGSSITVRALTAPFWVVASSAVKLDCSEPACTPARRSGPGRRQSGVR